MLRQVSQMAVHQLGRKTHGVGGDGIKAAFIHGAGAGIRQLHLKSKTSKKGRPERSRVPEREHAGDSNHFFSGRRVLPDGILLKKKFFSYLEKVCRSVRLLKLFPRLPLHFLVFRVSQNLSPLAPVVGNPGISIWKS